MTPGPLQLDLRESCPGQSKHDRLRDYFVHEIRAGRLAPGQTLPSEHRLAEALGVARMTVRHAMLSLEQDGLIRRVPGKGTFVAEDARRRLKHGLDLFALVVPFTREGFYASLLQGFEAAVGEIHHQTIICSTDNNVDRQADVILQLLDKKVGGVALSPTRPPVTPAYQVRVLQEHGIPVVFCHRRVEGVSAPLLAVPYREMGRLAARTLADYGHRHVAAVVSSRYQGTEQWVAGIEDVMTAAGGASSVEAVYLTATAHVQEEDVWQALQAMFSRPTPPTALLAGFDSIAEMMYLLLPRLGLRVPEDVSLIGFGGAWREHALTRRLTSVVIDEIATGRQAVSLLHEMRCGDRPLDDATEITLELGLSDGETLAAARRG
jgi:DNA-binding LacI/PurR family transcriptional regulator